MSIDEKQNFKILLDNLYREKGTALLLLVASLLNNSYFEHLWKDRQMVIEDLPDDPEHGQAFW